MMRHTAIGDPSMVREQLAQFRSYADADELIVVLQATTISERLRAVELLSGAYQ